MKIILVNISPPLKHGLFPLGIAYLKSVVKADEELKDKVDFFVFSIAYKDAEERLISELKENHYDLIGFGGYIWSISKLNDVAKSLKENNIRTPIVVGGPEVSYNPESFLTKYSYFDVAIFGEGEKTFLELVRTLYHNSNENFIKCLEQIKGLAYKDKIIHVNPGRPLINLDELPSPYIMEDDLLDNYSYIPIETHRGCSYRCHFCFYNKNFLKVRRFSLDRISNELKILFSKNISKLYIMDPTFNLDVEFAKQVCELIIKYNKNKIPIHTEIRAELVDEEFAQLLQKANILLVEVGLQSINETVLSLVNRSFNKENFLRGISLLKKYNISCDISIIIGLPGDNLQSFMETYNFVESLNPKFLSTFRLFVLPGTYLYEHADEFKLTFNNEPPYMIINTETFSKEEIIKVDKMAREKKLLKEKNTDISINHS